MYEFKLPDIGEGMHEGEIRRWLVREGDRVEADQPIVEVQTDKVTAELTAPVGGLIHQLCAPEGSVIPVGTVLALIASHQDAVAETVTAAAASAEPATAAAPGPEPESRRPVHRRALATPHVRSLARKLGVDIDDIPGTGPAGRVTEEDVKRYAELRRGGTDTVDKPVAPTAPTGSLTAPPTGPSLGPAAEDVRPAAAGPKLPRTGAPVPMDTSDEPVERVPLRGIRRRIAEHMVQSVRTIPHVTHVDEIEMEALHSLRDRLRPYAGARGVKLTYLPFFVKAVALALREFPYLNASVDDETGDILLKRYYHIGIATDTEEGLIVPVVRHADRKPILAIAAEIADLAARARAGRLSLQEVSGSTFTLSNVGPIGGLYATPIINHPEAAILGLHKVQPRTVVRDGQSVIRRMMYMSLSFDHRIIDGAMAVRFTNRIKELLENPEVLFLELA